jgi:hypothetical protein
MEYNSIGRVDYEAELPSPFYSRIFNRCHLASTTKVEASMNIIAVNQIKLKYQILAHSLFFEGIIAFYTNWFINDEVL